MMLSAPPRNRTPCGITTPTRPVTGVIEASMCWTHAKSPLLAGGTPQAARPHGSWFQTSTPPFFKENGGLVIPTSDNHVLNVVEEQVHAGDGGCGQAGLLTVEAHLGK